MFGRGNLGEGSRPDGIHHFMVKTFKDDGIELYELKNH